MPARIRKGHLQLRPPPISTPKGTPRTVATVNPLETIAIAIPERLSPRMSVAVTSPIANNVA